MRSDIVKGNDVVFAQVVKASFEGEGIKAKLVANELALFQTQDLTSKFLHKLAQQDFVPTPPKGQISRLDL